jgi:aconitate decarboxylase
VSDPLDALLDHAFSVETAKIPTETMNFQLRRVLDNLGCLVAGHDQAGTRAALSLARRWSGAREATVIGSTEKLAAPQAAFVNAVRARALDFCDVLSPGWHPSSSDVPVALAAAELSGAGGEAVLAALAVGQDVGQRINRAAQANGFFYRGFDSNVLGLLSGAIIAGRLLALTRAQMGDAVGLAFDFGIGTFQHYQDKVLAVRIRGSRPAMLWRPCSWLNPASPDRGGLLPANAASFDSTGPQSRISWFSAKTLESGSSVRRLPALSSTQVAE